VPFLTARKRTEQDASDHTVDNEDVLSVAREWKADRSDMKRLAMIRYHHKEMSGRTIKNHHKEGTCRTFLSSIISQEERGNVFVLP
jgi:hypothetical protein